MKKFQSVCALGAILFMAVACAPAERTENDPIETVNRGMFAVNEGIDMVLISPLAHGYRAITTKGMRRGVSNALYNLTEPVTVVNSLLQGDVTNAFTSCWRFILNTTLGFAGFYDFAGKYGGLPARKEDFGQTFAVWGMGEGPYLVLPIIGPSNLRDTVGLVGDILVNPVTWLPSDYDEFTYGVAGATIITQRESAIELIDGIYETSLDPYATFRSGYIQRRNAMIKNRGTRKVGVGYGQ